MGFAANTIKVCAFVIFTILAILGIWGIVATGLNHNSISLRAAVTAYVVSALIILIAIFGIIAVLRESICLAIFCAVVLLVVAVLHIGIVVYAMNHYESSGIEKVNHAWEQNQMDELQSKHMCCGKDSAQDYVVIGKPIPSSCYKDDSSNSGDLFIPGCSVKVQEDYDGRKTHFAILFGLMIAFELLGCLLSIFLVINFRNKQRRMQF